MTGRIHSIQTLGTLDGPGVRFVVFFQGCNLRCSCCHNPDTWEICAGKTVTAEEIVNKAERYREYFGNDGGITLSGGEPLLQTDLAFEIFRLCRERNINTCLDTSGNILDKSVLQVLSLCDRILLDIKYTNNTDYMMYAGCSLDCVLEFLKEADRLNIPTTLRQVVIPSVNDSKDNFLKLKNIALRFKCVDKIELLPFRKMCSVKYSNMGIEFPFEDKREPTSEEIEKYQLILQ